MDSQVFLTNLVFFYHFFHTGSAKSTKTLIFLHIIWDLMMELGRNKVEFEMWKVSTRSDKPVRNY